MLEIFYMGQDEIFNEINGLITISNITRGIQEVQPTMFFGVPRVYEKIQEKMQEVTTKHNLMILTSKLI